MKIISSGFGCACSTCGHHMKKLSLYCSKKCELIQDLAFEELTSWDIKNEKLPYTKLLRDERQQIHDQCREKMKRVLKNEK